MGVAAPNNHEIGIFYDRTDQSWVDDFLCQKLADFLNRLEARPTFLTYPIDNSAKIPLIVPDTVLVILSLRFLKSEPCRRLGEALIKDTNGLGLKLTFIVTSQDAYSNAGAWLRSVGAGDHVRPEWQEAGVNNHSHILADTLFKFAYDLLRRGARTQIAGFHPAPSTLNLTPSETAWFDEKRERGEYDVFLCHNSEDKPAVKHIAELLIRNGLAPWLDEWELQPGLPWQMLLEEQIDQIKSAAVFAGESGIGPWQQVELDAFLREFVGRRCPVIPVILASCTKPPTFPKFLRGNTWVDFRVSTPDPLARLVWGITGKRQQLKALPTEATPAPPKATPAPTEAAPAPPKATPVPAEATPAPRKAKPARSRLSQGVMMLGASAAIAVLTFGIWYAATQRTMGGGDSPTERTVTIAEGRLFQKTLCVTPSRTFDAPTRNALMKFNAAFSYPGTDAPSVIYDDSDLSNLRSAQSMFPDCEKAGFLSSFEVGLFTRFGAARIHTYLNQALIRADIAVPVAFSNEPLMLNRAARMAIASLSKKYGLGDVDEITPLFYDRMIKSLAK